MNLFSASAQAAAPAGGEFEIRSLRFENASFAYEEGAPIFERATVELPAGCTALVASPAREGRSTLLRLLAGLEAPSAGSYLINGEDVGQMSFEEFLPFRKRIGFSFDFGGLIANRTLWQNVMLPLEYHRTLSPKDASERVAEICRSFGIWDRRDSRPASVSGGSRKACAVARAFVMDPELLLLDDPFVALDDAAVAAVLGFVAEGRRTGRLKHVFFTSQDDRFAEELGCDAVVEIEGRKLKVGKPKRRAS